MRKCPDCGVEIVQTAVNCKVCGWTSRPKEGHSFRWASKVEGDWVDLQCAWNDRGQRCEHYGTLSGSTNGRGPWYCRRHYGSSGPGDYSREQETAPAIRELIERYAPGDLQG